MRLAIATLGCKTNSYESAAIASAFPEGWELVDFSTAADVKMLPCSANQVSVQPPLSQTRIGAMLLMMQGSAMSPTFARAWT